VSVDSHLGTVDVIDVDGSSPVGYCTEVTPDEVANTLGLEQLGEAAGAGQAEEVESRRIPA
jgi:hypothetical protein